MLSVAVLVLTAAGIVWRARNKRWGRDAQLALNAQARLSLILPVFLVLFAAVTVILGVGSLEAGFAYGWGYFPLALDALLIVTAGEPRSEQDIMAKTERTDGTSERKRISIPKVDTSVLDWWERQHDAGMSIRVFIRREIERSGYADVVHGRVEERLRDSEA